MHVSDASLELTAFPERDVMNFLIQSGTIKTKAAHRRNLTHSLL